MEYKEAMLWLATIDQAEHGDKDAKEMLKVRNMLRTEEGLPTIQEEIDQLIAKGRAMK